MLTLLALLSCAPKPAAPEAAAAAPAAPAAELPAWARAVLDDMDPTADPCQDFFRYACGGWLDRTELPPDKPAWVRSFSEIAERNRSELRDILERAAADPGDDPDRARLGAFWKACMDEEAAEASGLSAIRPLLDEIAAAEPGAGVAPLLAELQLVGVSAFFGVEVEGDFREPRLTILHFVPGGLALPDRDYYLAEDDAGRQLLEDYRAHVARVLELSGEPAEEAARHAALVLDVETRIARATPPREELRDPQRIYHRLDRAGVAEQAPALDWDAFLAGLGVPDAQQINVYAPETLAAAASLAASLEPEALRAYLRWQLLHAVAAVGPKALAEEDQAFFGARVYGRKEMEPRWKRCVRAADAALGDVLGRAYVEKHFPGEAKAAAREMLREIEDAFGRGLDGLAWMDDETRAAARAKRDAVANKIGYPDRWRDYSDLEIRPDDHLANVLAGRRHEAAWMLGKVGKEHDPDDWFMTPPTVNAYYHPLYNEMVFPAGILQPPFYDPDRPEVLNLGSIGAVMGHELCHGFDDQGSRFDAEGRMVPWWTEASRAAFEERTQCVVDHFARYEVAPGLHVNGRLTLGENLADLAGLRTAYRAWRALEEAGRARPANLPGLTDEQLFFVAYAQSWCAVSAPEFDKMLVLSDPHTPYRYRVLGPLSTLPEFHAAFQCPAGTPMHPEPVCEVW